MTRTDTPPAPDERATLLQMLTYVRETALAKVDGLDDELARHAPLPASPQTAPAALLHHLRWVEHDWVERVMLGHPDTAPWSEADPDGEFTEGLVLPFAEVVTGYRAQCARNDELVADLSLDDLSAETLSDFHPNLRWILLHLVEETARHNGHLDLLREMADGVRGD